MLGLKNLQTELKEGIFYVTINRPEKLNALNAETIEEIRQAVQEVYDNTEIKGAIITGAGEKAFVAGADISEISELTDVNARKFSENGQEVFALIEQCHKPIVAAVNGFALGGGCELAMACHIRLATSNARFGQPEVNLGIIPGYGGTQRLTHLIGRGKALELMLTGDQVNAHEAKNLGLVNRIVENSFELLNASEKMVHKIMAKAPLAIGMVIDCVNDVFESDCNGYQTEANSFANCIRSSDFKEGTNAFLEKRAPEFKGE
jgi:enoyl-CoA hydratase